MEKIDKYAKKLYNYHVVRDSLEPADIILIFTSLDLTVPEYAATLYLDKHLSDKILIAGNNAVNPDLDENLQETDWNKPEAEKFKDVMVKMGVPEEVIITEIRSTNSQQNVEMSYELLKDNPPKKIILVQKPTMGRRALATFKKHWPLDGYQLMVTSQDLNYEEYMRSIDVDKDTMINIMVGDLQRILIYPEKGYMIHQDVPKDVLDAYEELIDLGYTKHMVK
jgi:uncharacterized SAM-binding protein YcdF (DUF218 family)